MGAGDQCLTDGAAHLLLLGTLLAVGQPRRDLGQRLHGVVAGLAGRPAVVGGRVRVFVPIGLHPMIMPARGDKAGAVGSLTWPCLLPTRTSTRFRTPWTARGCPPMWPA